MSPKETCISDEATLLFFGCSKQTVTDVEVLFNLLFPSKEILGEQNSTVQTPSKARQQLLDFRAAVQTLGGKCLLPLVSVILL